jgi:hypothetical protein
MTKNLLCPPRLSSYHRYLQSIFNASGNLNGGGNPGDHPGPITNPKAPTLLDDDHFTADFYRWVYSFSFCYRIVAYAGIGGVDFTRYNLRFLKK